ncbi:MAG: uroporphyrinogen-III synthase [Alphaproteobacteria bacterium]|nr:uroporphyrinogen-III synthase [Alphaproteobacteria bacterium]
MRVLVTRPLEDAERTAQNLASLGHDAVISPLLEIVYRDGPPVTLNDVQALLATSANGVRAFTRRNGDRKTALFAVGPQTASIARAAGFSEVRSADGDAVALADAVAKWAKPEGGILLHICGARTRGGLAASLEKKGFRIRSAVLYEARIVDTLPELASVALRSGAIDAVMLYSPMTARVFAKLVAEAGLQDAVRNLTGIVISRAAADALQPLAFREIRIASTPDQSAMLTSLA